MFYSTRIQDMQDYKWYNSQGISYHIAEYSKPLTGYRKWVSEHQSMYPDENELRKECEEYMAEFDERERMKLQREKEMAETPDEVIFVISKMFYCCLKY